MIAIYRSLAVGCQLISILLICAAIIFLVPLALPYAENPLSYSYIRAALSVERSISSVVRQNVPTMRFGGIDLTRWIVVAAMFVLSGVFQGAKQRLRGRAEYARFRNRYNAWKADLRISEDSKLLSPLTKKMQDLNTGRKQDREELLKLFAQTKRKLEEAGRDLAFLAIDVVDSTGMKQGEERAAIEHDFMEYRRFVEATFQAHGCLKAAWTPDGVMSCFTTVDAAVRTAREILVGLDAFNRNVKTMRRDFAVRCGVNSGFVYFDDSVPLEEISDRVIDIAGHMQKHAQPNSVCVAKPAIEPLRERSGFQSSGRVVDGYEVYEWRKA